MMHRLVLALLVSAPALAQPAPGSNMPPDFYPHSPCVKPGEMPKGAPGVQDQDAMMAYNLKIKAFNQRAGAFNACIKTYVDNAQRDIEQIQAIVRAAVTEANRQ